jgi:hypothetical protein
MTVSSYERSFEAAVVPDITEEDQQAVKRILIGLKHVLGMECAPIVPLITPLLLTAMSESYAFCAVQEMAHQAVYYFPCSPREHAFGHVMHKLHPHMAVYLEDRGI